MERPLRVLLYVTVAITGAAVLVIEVAAVRILSPYFGASLYVFSSVLTIILAALSLGYYVGGRIADRFPTFERLYALIAVSGVTTLLAEFLALTTLPGVEGIFSVLTGPLIFGSILFFAPGFLLGIVSPYIIKLISRTGETDAIGTLSGTVFFYGTMGSIVGSLLSGFVLIPVFGVRMSMVSTGIALVLLGIIGALVFHTLITRTSPYVYIARYSSFVLSVGIMTTLLLVLIFNTEFPSPHKVLYRADGIYGHILVYETELNGHLLRALKRDTNNESAVYLDSYDLPFEYTQFFMLYPRVVKNVERALMIGGGAYTVPRSMLARDEQVMIDVVEVEPTLFDIAHTYFDVPDSSRLVNHIVDGRVFLNQEARPYDLILMDAFGTDLTLPAHLATREFFQIVRKKLNDEGVFMVNYVGNLNAEAPSLTGSLLKTLYSVFPNIKMYGIYRDTDRRQNILFVARKGNSPINFEPNSLLSVTGDTLKVSNMEVDIAKYLNKDELVFTDDRAPIEYLMLAQYK